MMGLWQKGAIGPFLPMYTSFEENVSEKLTNYLNENIANNDRSDNGNSGLVFVPSTQLFYYVHLYHTSREADENEKQYVILHELDTSVLPRYYFLFGFMVSEYNQIMYVINHLDQESRYEDIVDHVKKTNLENKLDVDTVDVEPNFSAPMIDKRLNQIYLVFAHLLDLRTVYIINDNDINFEDIIDYLNMFLGKINDISQVLKLSDTTFQKLSKDRDMVDNLVNQAVIIRASNFSITTELDDTIHVQKLKSFIDLSLENKVLEISGYVQQQINDYFNIIRTQALDEKISKDLSNLQPFADKISFVPLK